MKKGRDLLGRWSALRSVRRRTIKTIATAMITRSVTNACGPIPKAKATFPSRPRLAQPAVAKTTSAYPTFLLLIGALLEPGYNSTLSWFAVEGEGADEQETCLSL